jgi:AraC family transcriptional activator of pobA
MDFCGKILHNPIMPTDRAAPRKVPTFQLYGEAFADAPGFWLHCETLAERSRHHRWEIHPHRHEAFFQLFYVSEGEGEALLDGSYRPLRGPAAVFVKPGETHGFRWTSDVDGVVLTVAKDRLAAIANIEAAIAGFVSMSRIVALTGDFAENLAKSVERVLQEVSRPSLAHTALLEALVVSALIDLVRAGGAAGGQAGEGRADGSRVRELQQLVAAHFREHRSVAFYAARMRLSEAHLNRVCRAGTGRSVQQLLAERIVQVASRDLVFTSKPVQEIAFALGFSDPAYFNRFFRRHVERTPGAFRLSERKRLETGA